MKVEIRTFLLSFALGMVSGTFPAFAGGTLLFSLSDSTGNDFTPAAAASMGVDDFANIRVAGYGSSGGPGFTSSATVDGVTASAAWQTWYQQSHLSSFGQPYSTMIGANLEIGNSGNQATLALTGLGNWMTAHNFTHYEVTLYFVGRSEASKSMVTSSNAVVITSNGNDHTVALNVVSEVSSRWSGKSTPGFFSSSDLFVALKVIADPENAYTGNPGAGLTAVEIKGLPRVHTNPGYRPWRAITVEYNGSTWAPGNHVAILPRGENPVGATPLLSAAVTNATGSVVFPSPGLPLGDYDAWLLDTANQPLGNVAPFAIVDTLPTLSLDKADYAPGDTIVASYTHGPGNAKDWIAIYPQSVAAPSGSPASTLWQYTSGTEGQLVFQASSLAPGHYNAWFLANDGYSQLDGPIPFSTVPTTPPQWLADTLSPRPAMTGEAYSALLAPWLADMADISMEKREGPAWLNISSGGVLSGTPAPSDAGLATFHVRATRAGVQPASDVLMQIPVFKPGTEHPPRLSVMTYNVWHQWTQINGGFAKGIASIIRSGADVVAFQESSTSHAQNAANALGWFRASVATGNMQIISRYPIVNSYMGPRAPAARIRLSDNPRRDIIVYSEHPDYTYYGPYAAESAGATPADVLAEENRSSRTPQIQSTIGGMVADLANADVVPVFLAGDFNAPSHLDWTAASAPIHNNVGPVPWPASMVIESAGMIDSYRLAHPDPLADPGNTWSPIHKSTEPQDRIDILYHKGLPLTLLSSEVFTTEVEGTTGRWGTTLAPVKNNTWPSDHAAVVSIYALAPVDSDNNGLPDAWENLWFGQLGNNPSNISPDTGLSHASSVLLGLPPAGPASAPLAMQGQELVFSVSDYAIGHGLALERSLDLQTWEDVWSFDSDTSFKDTLILETTPISTDSHRLRMTPRLNANESRCYFRLRWVE